MYSFLWMLLVFVFDAELLYCLQETVDPNSELFDCLQETVDPNSELLDCRQETVDPNSELLYCLRRQWTLTVNFSTVSGDSGP